MKAQLAVLFGLVALLVDVSAFVARSCGSNEILASSPPSCESTCFQACASSPTGVYEPTCICMPTFVRNNGQCVPKASCPAVVVAMHPMFSAMAGSSGDVAYMGPSAAQQPAQGGALPGLLSSMFGSGSDSSVEGPATSQLGGSSPSDHGSLMKQLASEVAAILQSGAASPTSSFDESLSNEIPFSGGLAPENPPGSSSGGPAPQNPPVSSASTGSQNVAFPPLNPAALKADCKYSGVCPINQVQMRKKICCEPTCFDDCTGDACTFTNNTVPNCVCLPGYVRHMGHCIRPKYCPQGCTTPEPPVPCILETTPCDIEEIPTEPPCEPVTTPAPCPTTPPPCPTTPPPCPTTPAPCAAATTKPPCGCAAKTTAKPCPPNSTFSSCTPCCEPTCDNDCRTVRCISPCSGEPSCVCNRDYVKQNGRCIPRIFCPNAGSSSGGGGFFGGF